MPRRFYFAPMSRTPTRSGWEDFSDALQGGISQGVNMAQVRQDFRHRDQGQQMREETHETNLFERGFRRPGNVGPDPIMGELSGGMGGVGPSGPGGRPRSQPQFGSIQEELGGAFPHVHSDPNQNFPVPDHQGMGDGIRNVSTRAPDAPAPMSLMGQRGQPAPRSMEDELMGGAPPTFARESFRVQGPGGDRPMTDNAERRQRLERVTDNLLFDPDLSPAGRARQQAEEDRQRALTEMQDTLRLTNPDLSSHEVERIMAVARHNPDVLATLYQRGIGDVEFGDEGAAGANEGVVALIQAQFPDLSPDEAYALAGALQETGQSLPASLFQSPGAVQGTERASWEGPQRFSDDWFEANQRYQAESRDLEQELGDEGQGGAQQRTPGSLTRLQAQNIIESRYTQEAQGASGNQIWWTSPQEMDRMAQELFEQGTYNPAPFQAYNRLTGSFEEIGATNPDAASRPRGGRSLFNRGDQGPPEAGQLDTIRARPPGAEPASPQTQNPMGAIGPEEFDFDSAAAAEGFGAPGTTPGATREPGPPTVEPNALTGAYLDMYVEEVASVLSEVPYFQMDRAVGQIRQQLIAEGMTEADADRVIQMARSAQGPTQR